MKKPFSILIFIFLSVLLGSCDIPLTPIDRTGDDDIESSNYESFDRLFQDESYKTLTIKITSTEFNLLDQHMRAHFQKFGDYRSDIYVEADIIFSDHEGEFTINHVGLRTRGNLSRGRIKYDTGELNLSHFKLSFKEDFGRTELRDQRKRTVFELEEIDMKYNRNRDETYLNEKFSMDLFQSYGLFAQHVTFAHLFLEIDDEVHDYGIYTLFEPIDKKFMERRLPKAASDGDLYKVLWQQFGPATLESGYPALAIGIRDVSKNYRPSYDLKNNKRTSDHSALKAFIHDINTKDGEAFYAYIESHFEVDLFLRYLAINVLIGNPDDYRAMGNNYYLYHNPSTDKWMVIPYDFDHGLGQGWHPWSNEHPWSVGLDIYTWQNLSNYQGRYMTHPLSDKILSHPSYQIQFEAHLYALIHEENLFDYTHFQETFEKTKTLYASVVESSRFDLPSFGLRNSAWYFEAKTSDVLSQLKYLD